MILLLTWRLFLWAFLAFYLLFMMIMKMNILFHIILFLNTLLMFHHMNKNFFPKESLNKGNDSVFSKYVLDIEYFIFVVFVFFFLMLWSNFFPNIIYFYFVCHCQWWCSRSHVLWIFCCKMFLDLFSFGMHLYL